MSKSAPLTLTVVGRPSREAIGAAVEILFRGPEPIPPQELPAICLECANSGEVRSDAWDGYEAWLRQSRAQFPEAPAGGHYAEFEKQNGPEWVPCDCQSSAAPELSIRPEWRQETEPIPTAALAA